MKVSAEQTAAETGERTQAQQAASAKAAFEALSQATKTPVGVIGADMVQKGVPIDLVTKAVQDNLDKRVLSSPS